LDIQKRTKIIATLGPATASKEKIWELVSAGVNAFRLNFSHGTYDEHRKFVAWIKEIREELSVPVGIMQDLGGPKIRVGEISNPPLRLETGDEIVFDTTVEKSNGKIIPVTYKGFPNDVIAGHHLFLADGAIELEIKEIQPPRVVCRVLNGGLLTSKKGINYPGGSFRVPSVTEKDIRDLQVGLECGVDFVAVSFVRSAADLELVREKCMEYGRIVPLIVKIEKHEAIENLDEITAAADGLIVARGDLGVEIAFEKVPSAKRRIIRVANLYGKPVIIATQMLASMLRAPRPTRAEVSDIANSILAGADALLLSDETAVGQFPVEAIRTIVKIAVEVETHYPFGCDFPESDILDDMIISTEIAKNAADVANALDAPIIICPTSSGFTARMLSRFRPEALIYALTSADSVYYFAGLIWGVVPRKIAKIEQFDEELMHTALQMTHDDGLLGDGDYYVVTAGFPFGESERTNMMQAGIFHKSRGGRR